MPTVGTQAPYTVIDEIVYLASLVSHPQLIDSRLDVMRRVTARVRPGEPLSQNDQLILEGVRKELRTYLVTSERMRSFTAEQLDQKLYEHFRGKRALGKLRILAAGIVAGMVIAALTAFFLPISLASDLRIELVIVTLLMSTYVGAAVFFVSSLGTFSPILRKAYGVVAVGLCIAGVGLLQEPFLLIMGVRDHVYIQAGGVVVPYIIAYGLVYLGLSKFARLLSIQDGTLSLWRLAAALLAAVIFAIAVPHAATSIYEPSFDTSAALTLMIAVFAGFATRLIYRIWRASSPLYAIAMKWFFWALVVTTYASLQFFAGRLILGEIAGAQASIIMFPFIISAVLLFKAGYSFSKLARQ